MLSARSLVAAPLLVSPRELIASRKSVHFLDASWFMPASPRDAFQEFLAKRIKGAQYLDLDSVASQNPLGLKHMMPSERAFADACERFGIFPSSHVVLYDSQGVFSSPRALFMFRSFGHRNSSVLNGGLPLWELENGETESDPPVAPQKSDYPTPTLDSSVIRDYEQMVSNTSTNTELVLDARPSGRFTGKDPEPRQGLRSGHMPFSVSLPFTHFIDKHVATNNGMEYTTLRSPDALKTALIDAIGRERVNLITQGHLRVITSCGSGMTAGILWLGLKQLGIDQIALYDESWTGYAMRPSSVIETS